MKKYIVSTELTSNNFTKKINLVKSCITLTESDKTLEEFIGSVQEDLNRYVFMVAHININSLFIVHPIDWISEEQFINSAFIKVRRTNSVGYRIHKQNSSEIWYDDNGEIMRISIKIKELNKKDCVMISPLMTDDLYLLDDKVSKTMLDSLWKITQLYEINKLEKNNKFNDLAMAYFTEKQYDEHLQYLWVNSYERKVEYQGHGYMGYEDKPMTNYLYIPLTKNDVRFVLKKNNMQFNNSDTPKTYFFPNERLDYNDYDMDTGKVIEYTNLDYSNNLQKENSLLVSVLRSEDDISDLFKLKNN